MYHILMIVILSFAGMGFFIYAKSQQSLFAFLAGMILCFSPYFIHSTLILILLGLTVSGAAFYLRD